MRRATGGLLAGACLLSTMAVDAQIISKSDALTFAAGVQENCRDTKNYRAELEQCIKGGKRSQACFSDLIAPSLGANHYDALKAAVAEHAPGGLLATKAANDVAQLVDSAATAVPVLGGAIDNFLPGVRPAALQALGELEDPQTLGAAVALPRLGWIVLRVGGFANPVPRLNPMVEDAATSRNQLEAVDRDFEPEDDYYVTGDLSLVGPWFGREGRDHVAAQSRLSRSVMAGYDIANDQDNPRQPLSDVATYVTIPAGAAAIDADEANALACAAELYNRMTAEANRRVRRGYLGDFWRFVHNQPQLTIAGRRFYRDDLVGADSHGTRATFSTGLLNNLTFLKLMRWRCSTELGGDGCASLYQRMAEWPMMRHGLGLSAYYERGNIADVSVTLPAIAGLVPQPALPVPIEGGDYERYGWSVGFSLHEADDATKDASLRVPPTSIRLDGGTDYFEYETGAARLDHKVTKLTLTYRRGNVSVPVHLMYRTQSEFEAEVADEIVIGLGGQVEVW
jgi:hypothetical protein